MAPAEFEHNEDLAGTDWGQPCSVDRDPSMRWYVEEKREHAAGWSDDVRELMARRSRGHSEPSIEEVVAGWARHDDTTIHEQFDELATTWRAETAGAPFLVTRIVHGSYQRIIGMGPHVLPLILQELARETDHWFWALNAISGEDPAEGVEEFEEAAAKWLAWGRSRKLVD